MVTSEVGTGAGVSHRARLSGLGVAMVTPFDAFGAIDYQAGERLVDHLIGGGVDYLVVLGTTGEAPTLSAAEQGEWVRFVVEQVGGRVPIVVGCSGNDTRSLVRRLERLDYSGVDYVLSAVPSYNKPSQRGIAEHFRCVAAASGRPVILYNVPGRTGRNMEWSTCCELSMHANIVGVKEASGSVEQVSRVVAGVGDDFAVLSGDDSLTLSFMSVGACGVISVIGNALPERFGRVVHAALHGDWVTAQEENLQLLEMYDLLFAECNPSGVKVALSQMGICANALRLPLVPVSAALETRIGAALRDLGVL